MIDGVARLVDDDWTDAIDVGSGVRMLAIPELAGYRVEHTCKTVGDVTLVIAPKLTVPGHVVLCKDPLTITPSISCPDCGLHGFVTDGTWRNA